MKPFICLLCLLVSFQSFARALECRYTLLRSQSGVFRDRFDLERDRPSWKKDFRSHAYHVTWARDQLLVSARVERARASGHAVLRAPWASTGERQRTEVLLQVGDARVSVSCL